MSTRSDQAQRLFMALVTIVVLLSSARSIASEPFEMPGFLEDFSQRRALPEDVGGVIPLVAISASAENQLSWATKPGDPDGVQSCWTRFLLQGLAGSAADDGDAGTAISGEELYAYTGVPVDPTGRNRTSNYTLLKGGVSQNPRITDQILTVELDFTVARPGGTVRALLVGNGDYPGGGHDLDAPVGDATAMQAALLTFPAYVAARTLLRTNRTKANLVADLTTLLDDSGPNDVAVFYYSGHGTQVADANGDEVATNPGDALDETLLGSDDVGLTDDEFRQILLDHKDPDTWLLILLDNCYSYGTAERVTVAGSESVAGVALLEAKCSDCACTPPTAPGTPLWGAAMMAGLLAVWAAYALNRRSAVLARA